jgi:hypothetical protein
MPIKLFQDGEILDASDVNTYFMDQALVVFDDSTQRDAAFGGALEPGLSEGRICYLKSDDTIYIYTGSAWTAQLANIANGAITTVRLDGTAGSEAVTTAKIRDLNVTEGKLAAGAVTSTKLGSSLSLTGSTSIEQILEKATVSGSALSSTTHLDALSGAVYYNTASTTSNITLNLRGDGSNTLASLVPAGKAFSCVFMITSGSVNGKILTVTAGSSTVALKWFGGNVSPAGSSGGSVDVYTITAVKTSDTGNGTFHIFISQSKFA